MHLGRIALLLLFLACWVGAALTFSLGATWPVPAVLFLVSLSCLGGIALALRSSGEVASSVIAFLMIALMFSLFALIPGISSKDAGLAELIVFEANLIGLGAGMLYFLFERTRYRVTSQTKSPAVS